MNLPKELEALAEQMRMGAFTESSAAVLLTRDANTGIMTICPYGSPDDCDHLMIEAAGTRMPSLAKQ